MTIDLNAIIQSSMRHFDVVWAGFDQLQDQLKWSWFGKILKSNLGHHLTDGTDSNEKKLNISQNGPEICQILLKKSIVYHVTDWRELI